MRFFKNVIEVLGVMWAALLISSPAAAGFGESQSAEGGASLAGPAVIVLVLITLAIIIAVVTLLVLMHRRLQVRAGPPSETVSGQEPAAIESPPPPVGQIELAEQLPEQITEPQPGVATVPLPIFGILAEVETLATPLSPIPPVPRGLPAPSLPQFLEATDAEGELRHFALNQFTLTVGRAADNDIVIGDEFAAAATVADHHARIELRDPWVIIQVVSPDLTMFVNGQQTGRNILRNGWQVMLGKCALTFRTAGLGTAPLSEPERQIEQASASVAPHPAFEFALLPDGAVLNGRHIVLEGQPETSTLNTYVTESLQPILRCAQCGDDSNEPKQRTCHNCGASLADTSPYYPHFRIKESLDKQSFGPEQQLIGLSHPHALLPRQSFAERPFGESVRYYLVVPESPPKLALTARGPQELPQVLEWTQQLAQGMAYLHNNGVGLGPIDLWRVALEGNLARWVDFSSCALVPPAEQPKHFAAEVRALAEMAYYLITAKRKFDETIEISPPGVGMMFLRILGGLTVPTAEQFAAQLQAALVEVRRPSSVDVRVGRLTDVGQVRQLNEDSLLTIDVGRIRRSISEPLGLYAVCDGMGGQSAGDVASDLAVQTLAHKALTEVMSDGIMDNAAPNWESWLKSALQEANQAVFGHRRAAGNDMGTTCVAALVHDGQVTLAHAGDSRCYLINGEGLRQLTSDHSLVQRLIQLGQLTPAEARVHPQRNVIYKSLGDKSSLEPDVTTLHIAAGDRLLLCSDGLTTMLEDNQIQQIVLLAHSSQDACRNLIQAANEAGGEDNISAIVVQVEAL